MNSKLLSWINESDNRVRNRVEKKLRNMSLEDVQKHYRLSMKGDSIQFNDNFRNKQRLIHESCVREIIRRDLKMDRLPEANHCSVESIVDDDKVARLMNLKEGSILGDTIAQLRGHGFSYIAVPGSTNRYFIGNDDLKKNKINGMTNFDCYM